MSARSERLRPDGRPTLDKRQSSKSSKAGRPHSTTKSERDLYKELLAATAPKAKALDDMHSTTRTESADDSSSEHSQPPASPTKSPSKADKSTVIIDAEAVKTAEEKEPGHTGHERRSQFTFVGEMLDDEDEFAGDSEPEFFDEGPTLPPAPISIPTKAKTTKKKKKKPAKKKEVSSSSSSDSSEEQRPKSSRKRAPRSPRKTASLQAV